MGRLSVNMLKLVLLAISAATVLSNYNDGGLCLSSGEVASLCTAGTPVADKVASAVASCAQEPEAGRALKKGKGKGKGGKGKKCPTMEEIFEDLEDEYGDDACVYYNMGWLDEEGNVNNDTITMDVMNLPPEVATMITHEEVAQCAEDMMGKMAEDKKFKRCSKNYSEEELSLLGDVASLIAGFKCFQDSFNQACGNFLRSQIDSVASSQPEAAGRGFRFACLATCQAANFASTTTCGLFVQWPCNILFPGAAALSG